MSTILDALPALEQAERALFPRLITPGDLETIIRRAQDGLCGSVLAMDNALTHAGYRITGARGGQAGWWADLWHVASGECVIVAGCSLLDVLSNCLAVALQEEVTPCKP